MDIVGLTIQRTIIPEGFVCLFHTQYTELKEADQTAGYRYYL